MMRAAARAICLLLLFCCCSVALAEVAIPKLEHRVTDLTGTLTQQESVALDEQIAKFETARGSQIAVLLVPSTKPEAIEQYSIRVAEAWKVGRGGTADDGVLVVVAKDDGMLRIEVGYGLEGVLPDAVAKRIAADSITPHFKRKEFTLGIQAGVAEIIRTVEAAPPPIVEHATNGGDEIDVALAVSALLAAFAGLILIWRHLARDQKVPATVAAGTSVAMGANAYPRVPRHTNLYQPATSQPTKPSLGEEIEEVVEAVAERKEVDYAAELAELFSYSPPRQQESFSGGGGTFGGAGASDRFSADNDRSNSDTRTDSSDGDDRSGGDGGGGDGGGDGD